MVKSFYSDKYFSLTKSYRESVNIFLTKEFWKTTLKTSEEDLDCFIEVLVDYAVMMCYKTEKEGQNPLGKLHSKRVKKTA